MAVLGPGFTRQRFELGESRETVLNAPSADARRLFPWYWMLVDAGFDTPLKMLAWKIYVRARCLHDVEFRKAIKDMCRMDVAFFACTLVWIFEPRPYPRHLPFCPWTDQVDLLAWADMCFPVRPLGVSKTRGIGVSWLFTIFFIHKWYFVDDCRIAVLTKDKDLLEGTDDNSLLGKFQFIHDHMPHWFRLDEQGNDKMSRLIEKHRLFNTETKSSINGFVSTNTKLRSLRFTCIWADEFAFFGRDAQEWMVSSGGTTLCRFMTSTWNSYDDMFHHIMYEEPSNLLRVFTYWYANYERWKGAYKIQNGRVVYIDKTYKHDPQYEFGEPDIIPEGTQRSPWVDAELLEPGIDRHKALRDIYGPALADRDAAFFRPETRTSLERSARTPSFQGKLDISSDTFSLLPTLKSEVKIWLDLPKGAPVPSAPAVPGIGPYVAGFDLGYGRNASYSVMEVIDATGKQVLEYATNTTKIKDFAGNAVKIARWIAGEKGDGHVLFDFEANGAGAQDFWEELERLKYMHVQTNETANSKKPKHGVFKSRYYGTWNSDANHANYTELERAILSLVLVVKSEEIWKESLLFGIDEKGQPSFPRMNKLGHGDRMAALAIAWHRARSRIVQPVPVTEQHPDIHGVFLATKFETRELWRHKRK